MFRPASTLMALAVSLTFSASTASAQHSHFHSPSRDYHQHSNHHSSHGHFHDNYHSGHGHDHLDTYYHDDHDHYRRPVRTPECAPYPGNVNPYADGGYPAYEPDYSPELNWNTLPGPGRNPQTSSYQQTSPYQQGRKNRNPGQPGYHPDGIDPWQRPEQPYDPQQIPQAPFDQDWRSEDDYQPNQFDQGPGYPRPYNPGTPPSAPYNQGPESRNQFNQPGPQNTLPYQYQGNRQSLPLPLGDRQIPDDALKGGLPTPPDTLPEILPMQP